MIVLNLAHIVKQEPQQWAHTPPCYIVKQLAYIFYYREDHME